MSRLVALVALVISAGIIFGYVVPTWDGSIASAKAAIASDTQALDAAAAYSAKENELAKEKSAISDSDLTRLSTFLPDSVNNVQLILDLNALAARSGVSISDINVAAAGSGSGTATGQTPVGSVDLSLTATGSYAAFRTFLIGIEKSERLLDVEQLSVKGSDTGVYTYTLTIRLYWLR